MKIHLKTATSSHTNEFLGPFLKEFLFVLKIETINPPFENLQSSNWIFFALNNLCSLSRVSQLHHSACCTFLMLSNIMLKTIMSWFLPADPITCFSVWAMLICLADIFCIIFTSTQWCVYLDFYYSSTSPPTQDMICKAGIELQFKTFTF